MLPPSKTTANVNELNVFHLLVFSACRAAKLKRVRGPLCFWAYRSVNLPSSGVGEGKSHWRANVNLAVAHMHMLHAAVRCRFRQLAAAAQKTKPLCL
jgi:hypothetical protein